MSKPERSAEIAALYQELILDHYRRPRNKGTLEKADASVEMKNPLCGDEITLQVAFDRDGIGDCRFSGRGCSISQASASMMTQLVKGKGAEEINALRSRFREMILGDQSAVTDEKLGSLRALSGVARFPARVKCALLAWNALESALAERAGQRTPSEPILTERLELIPATRKMILAALEGNEALGASLSASVPPTWPPEYLDAPSLEFVLRRMEEGQAPAVWWLYFVTLPRTDSDRTLIGSAGYKGPPSDDGMVEVGYGIVRDQHRQGYASEAVRGLLSRAFAAPEVTRVTAETYPELVGSIGVLRKCGFRLIGEGSEPGVIRYELTRAEFAM